MTTLRWPAAQSPFQDGEAVELKNGDRGITYTDGWGNMAYLVNGQIQVYFWPYPTVDPDDVKLVPMDEFETHIRLYPGVVRIRKSE
jgi:hypothetical protein